MSTLLVETYVRPIAADRYRYVPRKLMVIRRYKPGEEAEIWALYFNTTHQLVGQDYTDEQINRWAPYENDLNEWVQQLARTKPFVAVKDNQIVGFAELEEDGHIARFYCHHQWLRHGIGTALLQAIEAEARREGMDVLHAEVSTTAYSFFQAKGFDVIRETEHIVCGAPAKQYLMQKLIGT